MTNERVRQSYLERAEMLSKEHGRVVRRRLEVVTRLAGHSDCSRLAQASCLTRTTTRNGQEAIEIEYAATSEARALAGAASLLALWRGQWGIEIYSRYVRDVTLQEDSCQIDCGHAPQNCASSCNQL